MRRFAGKQVRTVGTVGGNIANGSPIGDMPPALIALGATLVLQQGDTTRDAAARGLLHRLWQAGSPRPASSCAPCGCRKPGADDRFRCYKISKRFDPDISAVMGAFSFTSTATASQRRASPSAAWRRRRSAPGRPRRRSPAQNSADPNTWPAALAALGADFAPIDDQRASARYRRDTAHALLRKALIEIGGTPSAQTRVVGIRESADVGR